MTGLSPMHMLYYPFAAGEAAGAVLRAHRHSARQLLAAAAAAPAAAAVAAPVAGPPLLGASGARRLRVAYVMADWREHNTLRLLASVLGIHDATRMQV
jgi:predicted O-linked N-acetylglucosamine transferase (SPINDLY family)